LAKAARFKNRIHSGEAALGAQIGLSDPAIIEILGRVGYDWLVVDTEHAASNTLTVQAMLQAGAQTEALVLARVLRLDEDEIRRFLDIGSPGILCPFINTGEDARRLVRAGRYPPHGIRGYGPRRAGTFGLDATEYFETANDAVLSIPIIESEEAIENIEAIVATEGIDAIMIGPMDLSISLGIFGQFDDPIYLTAIEKVRLACRKHGKAMGTGVYSIEHARRCAAEGDQLLLIGGDDGFLAAEALRVLEDVRAVATAARR
jgi:2-keto-3-deoxy-L-rhamnonate aldolase RhmA